VCGKKKLFFGLLYKVRTVTEQEIQTSFHKVETREQNGKEKTFF
jgi:hypothetical protein